MPRPRLHVGRIEVTPAVVRRLLAQVPAFADEPLREVPSTGTVNALYRVGERALARLPIMAEWSDAAAEAETLAFVAPRLRVEVPTVLHVGAPDAAYPKPWLLLSWLGGTIATPGAGGAALADDLAAFLGDLWQLPVEDARAGYRQGLDQYDTAVKNSLAAAADLVEVAALEPLWADALAAPGWRHPLRWTHSDLLANNVLLDADGRLHAVLDWEAAGVGDPACDLMSAWSMLDGSGRARLRELLDLDDDTWRRGRGWALLQAIIALPHYRETTHGLVAHSLHVLGVLAADG
ncbi:phosphotransferase [Microbacterium dauci]|uniref:Phosphotransferase n=1 Tax=Microbacterium dauci TaxID=3048008 RepID=A0ABT6ZFC1_9MICO|nr:phosphotransferase [Microbacterium sp. LX3-4]MDJ1114864.1 phosphotransferase [Microbacterium sp. LX3-4]